MASDNAKLASVLDQRIRAVLEETLRGSFSNELKNIIRTEMLGALGVNGVKNVVKNAAKKPAVAAKKAKKGAVGRPRVTTGCLVAGCGKEHRSRGYCSAHYQAARKYGWPMPAPEGFDPESSKAKE